MIYPNLKLSKHAKDRLRQRLNIDSVDAGLRWVKTSIDSALKTKTSKHLRYYFTDKHEIVIDGKDEVVVTIKPANHANKFVPVLRGKLTKEITKFMTEKKRELKKAEINVLQTQLNLLKAKNPNTVEIISARLVQRIDEKAKIEDEITAMEKAAESFGVKI